VDIVMIAFLNIFFGPNGYPSLAIRGNACRAASTAQQTTAPGLVNCALMAPNITACQQIGKPVLLSLGGSTGQSNFTSAAQAVEFASTLWALFGADTTNMTTSPLRPFGTSVVLDGFDIDSENDMPDYYGNFTSALRAKYATSTTKPFYLSGSPQCPIPDTSLPLDAMLQFDWVWPRFYNANRCQWNSSGFLASVSAWSRQLYINGFSGTRFYIGTAASNNTSTGFVPGASLQTLSAPLDTTNLSNFGGFMLWDGSFALIPDSAGIDYLTYAKNALLGLSNAVRYSSSLLTSFH
jgi:chitinase